jgi:hypothetical protein
MQRVSESPRSEQSVTTTAHHMAEAVTFLMRVAAEAGLPKVVLKLENVRATLIELAISEAPAVIPAGTEERSDGPSCRAH